MRIALYGASGTGKTTLAKMLQRQIRMLPEPPLNPVGSRSVAEAMGFDSPYDVDAAGKRAEFQRRLLEEKVAWEARHDAFVTDRTTWDSVAYTALHDSRAVDDAMMELAQRGSDRYTHVIFCPIWAFHRTADDPARLHVHAYHQLFELLVQGLVHRSWFRSGAQGVHLTCDARTYDGRREWAIEHARWMR